MEEHWIVPCNLRFFDIIQHFKSNNTVVWKNAFTIKKGDIVYIYIGKPIAEIRYKCIVVNDIVDNQTLLDNAYAIPAKKSHNFYSKKDKYMQLQLLHEYQDGTFPYEELQRNGLGQVQIQARTDRRLQKYINSVELSVE